MHGPQASIRVRLKEFVATELPDYGQQRSHPDADVCSRLSPYGISWVLGRYDRPWPERPIFGTVRCMTSASTARKRRVAQYLQRYQPEGHRLLPETS